MTDKINKYEVIERIAEGGFGVVYKARDPYLKRTVAVKTCTFVDEESRQRFFREAQIAARFDHPNVTLVHDFGVEGDEAFLVQEYLSGEDLLHKIQRRDTLPLAAKVEMLLQAARGLRYAHGRGIIHRDIKPGNLRVLENGEVKILDFGIAKPLGGSPLTQQGMTVGTLGYLSPEQIEGKELDKRTDIFSYGVVAYELIAYTSPFIGRDVTSILRSILGDAPRRLEEIVPDCPQDLADLVHRCLRRDRDQRYDDFEALLQDLERVHREIDRTLVAHAAPRSSGGGVKQKDTKPIPVTKMEEHAAPDDDAAEPDHDVLSKIESTAAPTTRAPAAAKVESAPEVPNVEPVEPVAAPTRIVAPAAESESTAKRWSPPPPL
ncbi:MAG: serine/threonine protein kinase, partial [Thermoanaerobaculia bacterium]|nr:serine/threonine protein kinase [Thermoanaerobaculia bacterium]